MAPEDLEKINEIYTAAIGVASEERAAFLAKACGGDRELQAKVEELIAAREKADAFFGRPAWESIVPSTERGEADGEPLEVDPDLPFEKLGDFKLITRLGGGGMGMVYLAEQESLGRKVALKVIHPERTGSFEVVKRFWREIDAMSRLSHRHIVTVFESGEDRGVRYFAMELVSGNDLDRELAAADGSGKTIPTSRALVWIRDIARALDHAHKAGIIHRDIKPSNIRISDGGEAILMDFGVARHLGLSTMTLTGEFRGTPHYASPEQVNARPQEIDARTDIYSLGVVLYETLTGEVPFGGETTEQVFRQILHKSPVPPRRLNAQISRDAETVILAAMEKEPARRYATMGALADDLEHLLNGEMIEAKPAGMVTKTWKKVRRYPVTSVSLAVAALALVVITVVFPWILATMEKEKRKEVESKVEIIKKERKESDRLKRLAEERLEKVLRLQDLKRFNDLDKKTKQLWPAHPAKIPAFEEWLHEARELRDRLDGHREVLESLRLEALPYDLDAKKRDTALRRSHPQWNDLQNLLRLRDELAGELAIRGLRRDDLDPIQAVPFEKTEKRIAELNAKVMQRRVWDFDDPRIQWWHDTLADLVWGLEEFYERKIVHIEKRLAFASRVEAETIASRRDDWRRAIESIADRNESPRYEGLTIDARLGFVPIGRDPDSGLWEFAHVQTGAIPERGADGRLVLTEATGLVFVLIPGGRFEMGAVRPSPNDLPAAPLRDPQAKSHEQPIHTVEIKPFLISKYEMTQGQTREVTGSRYGHLGPACYFSGKQHNLLHPVETVSWLECAGLLARLGLRLPTEAEWEYAARAGTTTVWSTGDEIETLAGAANVSDRTLKTVEELMGVVFEESLDDGYAGHAPVGSFRPNPFGLHDVHGNVAEWCHDKFHESYDRAPPDGSAWESWGRKVRVYRGGGWYDTTERCRSAARAKGETTLRLPDLGVRPACSLE